VKFAIHCSYETAAMRELAPIIKIPSMKDIYDSFKPFRNKIRHVKIDELLFLSWAYSRNYCFNKPIPKEIEINSSFAIESDRRKRRLIGVNEFELEFLLKIAIIEDSFDSKQNFSILKSKNLATVLKLLRSELSEKVDSRLVYLNLINKELNRIFHRQFLWQDEPDSVMVYRYFYIYSYPEINELVKNETGFYIKEFIKSGLLLYYIFTDNFVLSKTIKKSDIEIDHDILMELLKSYTIEYNNLRIDLKRNQEYNLNIFYSLNPLLAKPIIEYKNNLFCPFHTMLINAFTIGLFYRIVGKPGFDKAIGISFENYVGALMNEILNLSHFSIIKEFQYKKKQKKTSDWIILEDDCIAFIECKAKRMTHRAKADIHSSESIDSDIEILANSILQIYKTYSDYVENQYDQLPFRQELKFVPILLTMEEWYISGNIDIENNLNRILLEKSNQMNNITEIVKKNPYIIMSISKFESDIQIINEIGIDAFVKKRFTIEIESIRKDIKWVRPFHGEYINTFIKNNNSS